jgi:hypothetical protein
MPQEKIDWIKKYNAYCDFLESEKLPCKSQKEAREHLKEELNSIIAINGNCELYDSELEALKLIELDEAMNP